MGLACFAPQSRLGFRSLLSVNLDINLGRVGLAAKGAVDIY